jgi:hypothetical protein
MSQYANFTFRFLADTFSPLPTTFYNMDGDPVVASLDGKTAQPITLDCSVTGIPHPIITWTKVNN